MTITVFAKAHTTKEGRNFNTYVTRLTKTDGTTLGMSLKFGKDCAIPKKFPCNIDVEKKDCNFSERSRRYVTSEGEEKEVTERTLWVKAWSNETEYIDTSMDDFE